MVVGSLRGRGVNGLQIKEPFLSFWTKRYHPFFQEPRMSLSRSYLDHSICARYIAFPKP